MMTVSRSCCWACVTAFGLTSMSTISNSGATNCSTSVHFRACNAAHLIDMRVIEMTLILNPASLESHVTARMRMTDDRCYFDSVTGDRLAGPKSNGSISG
jgi:hypothetical protein